jgi:hypothetical protein
MISIPKDKIEQAKEIIERVDAELKAQEEGGAYLAEVTSDGVWIRSDESMNPEGAEMLVRTLVEELDLPGIFVCSWSYTCSKPCVDEFGGGAFAVQKGRDTIWIDAASEALRLASMSETNAQVDLPPKEGADSTRDVIGG